MEHKLKYYWPIWRHWLVGIHNPFQSHYAGLTVPSGELRFDAILDLSV